MLVPRRRSPLAPALAALLACAGLLSLTPPAQSISAPAAAGRAPNIVYILADDLGTGDVGAYGQQKIATPRLDRLAAEGMRFTAFYAGSPVCAPSRGAFLTGKHTGHAFVRDNHELGGFADDEERGQLALPATGEPTLAEWLRAHGYRTAAIGKWGLGGPGSTGLPTRHGFDLFFGYLDQKQAHNYYPSHLWKNEARFLLRNGYFSPHQRLAGDPNDPAAYAPYTGTDYAIDRMTQEAVAFLQEQSRPRGAAAARPFFLYFAPTLPHLALQVPEPARQAYVGRFPETAYTGDHGYLPQQTPRAAYAAMVTYLDTQVGLLLDALRAHGLDRDTVVFFTSDNGAPRGVNGGLDTAFFDSNAGLRGAKGGVYEGGIRVPMIARWPDRIAAGSTSAHAGANWDMWATFAELAGQPGSAPADGVSIAPTLLGRPGQREHEALYWEFHSPDSMQAVRMGRWKGIRLNLKKNPAAPLELYDLEQDPHETTNVAAAHPEIAQRMLAIMRDQHARAVLPAWNF